MQSRRGSVSLAVALAAVVLSVLGVLQTSTSDGRVVTPGTGTASTGPPTSPTGRGTHAGRTHAEPPGKSVRPRGSGRRRRRHAARRRHLARAHAKQRSMQASAHNASDPGVTIADFSFTPGTITVHVGDTVQWVNNGPSPHTATANNGSFKTDVLNKGQSASVTFHLPGTFDYHCSIHPFMHGAVVVLANAKTSSSSGSSSSGSNPSGSSSGSGGSGGGGNGGSGAGTGGSGGGGGTGGTSTAASGAGKSTGSSGTPGTASTSHQGTLPLTGVNVLAVVALGLVLSGAGLLLNRLRRGLG